ncbi:hypothetical protein QTI33_09570 [Variovorax sp. J22P271]|uniref:hypothetical protein n=1 Tax=Variovorax davisae TaxID=3053515 RepID=UPI0025778FE7|nr:hypothetical protein [Variovorax sp. J22P271]MDM0032372.1 hypothetical protein [Variovorax sp. J22P271]
MQESDVLFEDGLDDEFGSPLTSVPVGGVHETALAFGVHGLTLQEQSRFGYMAVLNLGADSKLRQSMYHVSLLPEVISAAERMRLRDFYVSNALFASERSRCSWNVKSMQLCWVDLDCYAEGIVPTDEFVETLLARAHFAGIPHPSHIVSSGRGLYLKWLLDKPVPDIRKEDWKLVQKMLTQLFVDLGADVKAIDAARVLRVVNTVNGKVSGTKGGDDHGLVRVVWVGNRRHSFDTLFDTVSLFDEQTTNAILKAGAKVGHRVGAGAFVPNFTLPPGSYGDVGCLTAFTNARQDRMRRWGKGDNKGRFDLPLSLARALDLRDLAIRRCRTGGSRGIPEGSRDLFLFWLVTLFAQGGVINSGNVYTEVSDLIRAFDGVGVEGPRGFLHPRQSGSLNALINRIKASEAGHRVRFAGGEWDPRYTPSNEYLINVFGITSDEMPGMRTIIDQGEKRSRADRKVEGRAERRRVRQSWNQQALRLRQQYEAAIASGDSSIPQKKVVAEIAKELSLTNDRVRKFFKRHDNGIMIAEARACGAAPAKVYRKGPDGLSPSELETRERLKAKAKQDRYLQDLRKSGYTGNGTAADVRAWLDAKAMHFKQEGERVAATALKQAQHSKVDQLREMNVKLERIMRKARGKLGEIRLQDQLSHEASGVGRNMSRSPAKLHAGSFPPPAIACSR